MPTAETIETRGLRKVCCYCRAELPGSDPIGTRTSHGACAPLCPEARAMGWGEPAREPVNASLLQEDYAGEMFVPAHLRRVA